MNSLDEMVLNLELGDVDPTQKGRRVRPSFTPPGEDWTGTIMGSEVRSIQNRVDTLQLVYLVRWDHTPQTLGAFVSNSLVFLCKNCNRPLSDHYLPYDKSVTEPAKCLFGSRFFE